MALTWLFEGTEELGCFRAAAAAEGADLMAQTDETESCRLGVGGVSSTAFRAGWVPVGDSLRFVCGYKVDVLRARQNIERPDLFSGKKEKRAAPLLLQAGHRQHIVAPRFQSSTSSWREGYYPPREETKVSL